jgi:hypothetical protein
MQLQNVTVLPAPTMGGLTSADQEWARETSRISGARLVVCVVDVADAIDLSCPIALRSDLQELRQS